MNPSKLDSAVLAALHGLADAFNRHDADAVVAHFADDGEMHLPHGPQPSGRICVGRNAVRQAVAQRFADFPDVQWLEATHLVSGHHGISNWTVSATGADGLRFAHRGVDLYRFDTSVRVVRKDSYWKS